MRLLVVEDESGIAEALRRGFNADGFVVDLAFDGPSGLELALTNDYAVIVLDLMLPAMSGYEVCSTLRRQGVHTPILMLTAKDGEYDELEGLESGADDYVKKPFRYPILLSRVRALIRRSAIVASAGDVLEVGDLRFHCGARRVFRGDTEIELSPRAMAVLEYLMWQRDLVVPKSQIVDQVWGPEFAGDPNIVEVYVSRIRAAIDTAFDRSSLETVRGVGYRLCDDSRGRG
ncbi:MAG: response regulator transcription factor [Acidimicrobiales bacterium]